MSSENAILGCQIFIAQQQLLVDEAGNKGQKACTVESIAHGGTFIIDELSILRRHSASNRLPRVF
jgi:hypothetical protein